MKTRHGCLSVGMLMVAVLFCSSSVAPKLLLSHQTISPKSGVQTLEEKNVDLKDAAWIWTATEGQVPIATRVELVNKAKDFVKQAFDIGKAVPVGPVGQGKSTDVSQYVGRAVANLPVDGHLLHMIGNFPESSPPGPEATFESYQRDWVKKNIRFVVVPDDENGFLADQGVAGTPEHIAIVAYGGFFPYKDWEKRLDSAVVEKIKRGMAKRMQNESLSSEELPGPPSAYLSETQVREFMKGGEEGLARFQDKLIHEIKDVLRAGVHKDESQEVTSRVNNYITKNMQSILAAKQKQKEAQAKRETQKFVKLHILKDLTPWVNASPQQWREIEGAINESLKQAQRQGLIYGFNAFVFNQGQQVIIDFDHRQGKMNADGYWIAQGAMLAGLKKAQELGVLLPDGESLLVLPRMAQKERLNWNGGEQAILMRASEPIMTTQALGLGMGAFNRPIWKLLVGDVGHLQSVGGERGFRVIIANLNDIRQGKKDYRKHVIDIPGMHRDRIVEVIKKIQSGDLTYEDLQEETDKNLYKLLQLAGAQDEYAIEEVYNLPGSRFGRTMQDEEPAIKVYLHENPTLEFRMQAGSWATGTFRKVLSVPWVAANAKQTHWVGALPVTLDEARDLSTIQGLDGWPTGELGFFTSWEWAYDKDGTGRGEPPTEDSFGVNEQTRITTRETEQRFRELLENWQAIGNFEPRLTAEETIRRASEAAAHFPQSNTVHAVPTLDIWEPVPDLNKGERDPITEPYQGKGKLTVSVFKADIGGKSGHNKALKTQMIAVTAVLEEAKEQGLIKDYFVYFIADDIQFAILHEEGVHANAIHQLAWNAFSFGYWAASKLGLVPYGPGQDIKIAGIWQQHPVEVHANVTRRKVEILRGLFEKGSRRELTAPNEKFREEQRLVSDSALEKFSLLDEALARWERGEGTWEGDPSKATDAGALNVGNVTGMGIGWFEKPVEKEDEFMLYGLDKSGPGGKNARIIGAVYEAIKAGDLSGKDIAELWDVELHRRIFLRWGEREADIRAMAAQVNKYNFKRFLDGGILNRVIIFAWLSAEKLAHIAGKYVGKDDPISGFIKKIARYLEKQLRTVPVMAQLGDEAGTHNLANVLWPWWDSTPGEKSNPVTVAINFKVADGRLMAEDLGSKPEFREARVKAEKFNRDFVEVQGEFAPLVANRRQVEPTYDRAKILEAADRHPDAVDPIFEDTLNALLRESALVAARNEQEVQDSL